MTDSGTPISAVVTSNDGLGSVQVPLLADAPVRSARYPRAPSLSCRNPQRSDVGREIRACLLAAQSWQATSRTDAPERLWQAFLPVPEDSYRRQLRARRMALMRLASDDDGPPTLR